MVRLCCTGARGTLWPGIRMEAPGVPPREPTELCELTGGGLRETGGFGDGRGGEELCNGGGGVLRLL
jgi:hypothetical protein